MMIFEPYPFEKLTDLLCDITPNRSYEPLTLTIGEPQFETPDFILKRLRTHADLLKKYPKTSGESFLKESMQSFVKRRFGVTLQDEELLPTFGTREVLFNLPQFLLFDIPNPVMAFTNPFYQIYEGAAVASRASVHLLNLDAADGFEPQIDEAVLATCHLVILNFPNNPTGATLTLDTLGEWVRLALKHDFILLNDECYSEIYTQTPPPSLLEASLHVGNDSFKNILVINSASKRSSAPGLRSGFIAGDATILQSYLKYRTYVGCASPLPLQEAAAVAWSDAAHVTAFREIYAKNFQTAKELLGIDVPEATFYIWLQVDDAIAFTCKLYKEYNLKVLPGEFLARCDARGHNPGQGYVRIALVENAARTYDALSRIKDALA